MARRHDEPQPDRPMGRSQRGSGTYSTAADRLACRRADYRPWPSPTGKYAHCSSPQTEPPRSKCSAVRGNYRRVGRHLPSLPPGRGLIRNHVSLCCLFALIPARRMTIEQTSLFLLVYGALLAYFGQSSHKPTTPPRAAMQPRPRCLKFSQVFVNNFELFVSPTLLYSAERLPAGGTPPLSRICSKAEAARCLGLITDRVHGAPHSINPRTEAISSGQG
jgi:hypothetical protein